MILFRLHITTLVVEEWMIVIPIGAIRGADTYNLRIPIEILSKE